MQGKMQVIFSYNFQLIDLWSIKLGLWDLAADKSAVEIIKIRIKESMQMIIQAKYFVPSTNLANNVTTHSRISKVVRVMRHVCEIKF
jgi:hypothetical protein